VAEKGAPVSIERASGGWLRLPATSGPHPNTLRAWLRRGGTEATASEASFEGTS